MTGSLPPQSAPGGAGLFTPHRYLHVGFVLGVGAVGKCNCGWPRDAIARESSVNRHVAGKRGRP